MILLTIGKPIIPSEWCFLYLLKKWFFYFSLRMEPLEDIKIVMPVAPSVRLSGIAYRSTHKKFLKPT